MPFCPKCKYEYQPEIEVCPDCDLKLVAKLHEEPEEYDLSADSDLIVAAVYAVAVDAHQTKLFLESRGVPAVVMGDILSRSNVIAPLMDAGVRVMVRRKDADRARQILETES